MKFGHSRLWNGGLVAACSCLVPGREVSKLYARSPIRACLDWLSSLPITSPKDLVRSEDEVNGRATAWELCTQVEAAHRLVCWQRPTCEMLMDMSRTRSSRLEVRFGCELASGRLIPRYLYPFQLS